MEGQLLDDEVAAELKKSYLAVAVDADDPEHEAMQLVFKLENAMMLPIVVIADSTGQFLDGFSGSVNRDRLLDGRSFFLVEAERMLELLETSRVGGRTLVLVDELFRGTNS